jgi:hypothetical protein
VEAMKFSTAALGIFLLTLGIPVGRAQAPHVVVAEAAPIFVRPNPPAGLQPLRVAAIGTVLETQGEEAGWYQVAFQDPQFGRRVGYIEKRFVKVQLREPMDLPVKVPAQREAKEEPRQTKPVATAASTSAARPVTTPPNSGSRMPGLPGVFITSAGAVNGLTDPSRDNADTVKDLRNSLKNSKLVTLVNSRDEAKIVLVVMNRETGEVTAGYFGDPARDRIIRVKFVHNQDETVMTASAQGGAGASGGAWGKAAGKIAKQVEQWVKANAGSL